MARKNIKDLTNEVMLHEAFADVSKTKVEEALRMVFDTIQSNIVAGNDVAIPGFGKFSKFTSTVTEKSKPKFVGAKAFKDAVNA